MRCLRPWSQHIRQATIAPPVPYAIGANENPQLLPRVSLEHRGGLRFGSTYDGYESPTC